MSVFKRPKAKHFSYDFQVGGQRFSGSTYKTSEREAKREEQRLKREAQVELTLHGSKSTMTFERAALRYLEEVGQHHKNALTTLTDVERLVARIGPTTNLSEIGNDLVARVVAQRRADLRAVGRNRDDQRPVSAATVNRSTTELLRKILRRAELIWEVAVQRISWREHILSEPKERVREASRAEEDSLFEHLSEGYDVACHFALVTGCRLAEIIGLTWDRVDFHERTVTIIGKGDNVRTIPMPWALVEMLKAQIGHHPLYVFTYVARRTDARKRLVKGRRYRLSYAGLKVAFRRTVAKAAVLNLRFHDLRHTAATRTLRKSNLRVVQHLLGHADVATTAKYAHAQAEDIRAALDATSPTKNPTDHHTQEPKVLKRPAKR